jgi:hypothetical protein
VLEKPTADTDGWFAVRIQVGKAADTYLVKEIGADGGRGFELEKRIGLVLLPAETYHVFLAADGNHSCECLGFLRWGHHADRGCKHIDGLLALVQRGELPAPVRPAVRPPADWRNNPELQNGPGPWEYPDEPPQLDEAAYFDPLDAA